MIDTKKFLAACRGEHAPRQADQGAEEGAAAESALKAHPVAPPGTSDPSVVPEVGVMISELLPQVSLKALKNSDEVLDMALPNQNDEAFGTILRAKTAITNTILTTQTKVDENALKAKSLDVIPDVIARIRAYEKENPTRIVPLTVVPREQGDDDG